MKSFIRISLLLLLPFFAKAQTQQKTLDSLKQALRLATIDSSRYIIADKLSLMYSESNSDSSLHYSEIALSVAEKNNMTLDAGLKLTDKAYQQYKLYRYGESLKNFLLAAKIAEDPASETKVFSQGKYPDLRKNRLEVLGKVHNSWGHLMGRTGDTAQQLTHYTKAKELFKETGNEVWGTLIKSNIGVLYTNLGKLDSALQFEQDALATVLLFKEVNGLQLVSYIYYHIGNIYLKKGDKAQAIENWHKAILLNNEFNQRTLITIYGSFSSFYQDEKNKDSSLYYAKKQLAMMRLTESPNIEAAYTNLYKSFELNGNKDSANFYKGLALEATEKTLKERLKSLGDFQKEAFKEQERLQQLEQEKIEAKNKLRNYTLFGVLAVFLIVGLLLYRNNRQKQKANKVLQEQKDKVESTLYELKATQSQLIQSEKMASLGELTAGIAHEIQNPLNFVNNFSEVSNELIDEMKTEFKKGDTEEGFAIADDIKQNLEKILHHGKRADAIVKGMLQHSSSGSGKKEPTNINALADEYLRLAYHGLRAKDKSFNATMKTDFDETIGKINIVPQDIGRVVLNLINNAFYVVDEKKKQQPAGYEPTVSVSTKKINGKVEIKVADNGNGIPQKILDKIFQPFFTTKPTGQGTGLGLSLSYDIVKAHGGEIKVETKEGEGSAFIIQLPSA